MRRNVPTQPRWLVHAVVRRPTALGGNTCDEIGAFLECATMKRHESEAASKIEHLVDAGFRK